MAEYIELDLLKMAIEAEPYFTDSTKAAFRNIVNKVPAADVVAVVRCKDCKHGEIDDPDFPDQHYCHEGWGWNKADFYCSSGERR